MPRQRNYPDWWVKTDKDLYRYQRTKISIARANQEIEDLEELIQEGRRTIPGWYAEAIGVAVQANSQGQQEEAIVSRLNECQDKLKRLNAFKDMMEAAIDLEFAGQFDKRRFIALYWWSNWPKSIARKLVMNELSFLTHKTFYDWRADIIRRMARILGHLPTNEQKPSQNTQNQAKTIGE